NAAALLVYAQSFAGAWHGRLLLPAAGAIAVLLVVGVTTAVPRARIILTVGAIGLVVLALAMPIVYLIPLHRINALETASVADIQQRNAATFARTIHVEGLSLDRSPVRPGESVDLRLFWR